MPEVGGPLQHLAQPGRVVERLGLGEAGAVGDLFLEPRHLDLHPRGVGIEGAADEEAGAAADRVPQGVDPGVQVGQELDEAEGVQVEHRRSPRLFAEPGRVAGHGENGADAEQARPHQVRLEAEQVSVAAGDVDDHLDARLPAG